MVKAIDAPAHRVFKQAALGFEMDAEAHASRPLPISPHGGARRAWCRPALKSPWGNRHVKPLHCSSAPKDVDVEDFVHGCTLIGFEPSAHQLRFARITNAPGPADPETGSPRPKHRRIGKTEPRRSGKTEGLWGLILGRCTTRPDYYAAFSAQSGKKGRDRFLKMAVKLEKWDPCVRSSRSNPDGCTRDDHGHVHYRIYRSNGGERIEWENGSVLMVLPPDPEAYRGEEFHLIVLDEGQETEDDDVADELLGGINPTMDTVPDAQLIVAGTAGKRRSGLLWIALERGRAGVWGILEYAAPDTADPAAEATWLAAHPGIGTLTTLEVIRENFADLSLVDFMREYLGMWPADATTSAIDLAAWEKARAATIERPRRVGLVFDVSPDGSTAAISCAWRDDEGRAFVEVLAFRSSTAWLPAEAHRIAREARVPLAYDAVGQNHGPAGAISRRRPPVRMAAQTMKDAQAAHQLLVTELGAGNLRHFGQKDLDLAVEGATWRNTQGDTARLFGHKASAHAITPLTSAAMALLMFDKETKRARKPAARPTVRTAA